MQIVKKSQVPMEPAHGGEGTRQMYLSAGEISNPDFQAFTHGFLPAHGKYSWHAHDGIDEMVLVLKGNGIVRDRDGKYPFTEGDFFVFPANVEHEIENTGDQEGEYVFVRIKT